MNTEMNPNQERNIKFAQALAKALADRQKWFYYDATTNPAPCTNIDHLEVSVVEEESGRIVIHFRHDAYNHGLGGWGLEFDEHTVSLQMCPQFEKLSLANSPEFVAGRYWKHLVEMLSGYWRSCFLIPQCEFDRLGIRTAQTVG